MMLLVQNKIMLLTLLTALLVTSLPSVSGTGRLIEPAMRSSLWRFDSSANINFNDHILNCGGSQIQHRLNGGQCGVCGDAYSGIRENELGGRYDSGTVVRRYRIGSDVTMVADLLAPRGGYIEVKLCPRNNPDLAVSQACFDSFPLKIINGRGKRLPVRGRSQSDHGLYKIEVRLPRGVTCSHCVIQWHYRTDAPVSSIGNADTDFVNCADVTIGYNGDPEAAPGQPDNLSRGPLAERIQTYRFGRYGTGVSPFVVNPGQTTSSTRGWANKEDFYGNGVEYDDDDEGFTSGGHQAGFPNLLSFGGDDDGLNYGAIMMGLLGGGDDWNLSSGRSRAQGQRRRQSQGRQRVRGRGGDDDDDDDDDDNEGLNNRKRGSIRIPGISQNYNKMNRVYTVNSDDDDDDDDDDRVQRQPNNNRRRRPNTTLLLAGLQDLANSIRERQNQGGAVLENTQDLGQNLPTIVQNPNLNTGRPERYDDDDDDYGDDGEVPTFFKRNGDEDLYDELDNEVISSRPVPEYPNNGNIDGDDNNDDGYDDMGGSQNITPTGEPNVNNFPTKVYDDSYTREDLIDRNPPAFLDNGNGFTHDTDHEYYDTTDPSAEYPPTSIGGDTINSYPEDTRANGDHYSNNVDLTHDDYDALHRDTPEAEINGGFDTRDVGLPNSDYNNLNHHGENYLPNSSPYNEPITNEPYGEPITNEPYGEPITNEPYGEPITNEPYGEPITNEPYGEPLTNEPHGEPIINEPHGEPITNEPHGEPITNEPYGEPITNTPYNEPGDAYPEGINHNRHDEYMDHHEYNDPVSPSEFLPNANVHLSSIPFPDGNIGTDSEYETRQSRIRPRGNAGPRDGTRETIRPRRRQDFHFSGAPDISPWMQHFLMTAHPSAGWGAMGLGSNLSPAYHQDSWNSFGLDYWSGLAANPLNSFHSDPLGQFNALHQQALAFNGHDQSQALSHTTRQQNLANHQHALANGGGAFFSWLPETQSLFSTANTNSFSNPLSSFAASHYLSPFTALSQTHPVLLCGNPQQLVCIATPKYSHIANADAVCTHKCRLGDACGDKYCACACHRPLHCVHVNSLQEVGLEAWSRKVTPSDAWCSTQCNVGNCPNNLCACQ